MTSLLIVPGLGGSGPEHWQTRWETQDPRFTRVVQRDWEQPACAEWVQTLESAVRAAPAEVVLVAHSLGCIAVAHWAARGSASKVRGALLVAPADVEGELCTQLVPRCFAPLPAARLPFRSLLVASTDDPYCAFSRARTFAATWGAELVDVGAQGHINAASNLGDWEQGKALLRSLL